MRGYFEIGIYHPKKECNVGTLWRSAYQLGAAGIFIIGPRFKRQASDTVAAYRQIPLREYRTFEDYYSNLPYDAQVVAIEMGGRDLNGFVYPARTSFLLGSEDHGLPKHVLDKCQHVLSLRSINVNSYNVAVAGSLVMYHKQFLNL